MVAEPSSALEPVEASAYKGAGGEIRAERLTCTYQQQGRPRLVGAADGYSYLREGAMGEPGRPGSAVARGWLLNGRFYSIRVGAGCLPQHARTLYSRGA